MSKIIKIDDYGFHFDTGEVLTSDHSQDCCESHYLDFNSIKPEEVEGLEFDISGGVSFERVEDYGIRLHPVKGFPVSIPGYGYNNGYYGTNIELVLKDANQKVIAEYDVSECQSIHD